MGDVRNRGTKERPMWCCRYLDVDGKRKHRPTHQPSKALAVRFLAEVEARVARGLMGIPEPTEAERQGKTMSLACHYVMAGGDLLALQKILGHGKFEMTQIYSHLAPDYMAGEIARLSFAARPCHGAAVPSASPLT